MVVRAANGRTNARNSGGHVQIWMTQPNLDLSIDSCPTIILIPQIHTYTPQLSRMIAVYTCKVLQRKTSPRLQVISVCSSDCSLAWANSWLSVCPPIQWQNYDYLPGKGDTISWTNLLPRHGGHSAKESWNFVKIWVCSHLLVPTVRSGCTLFSNSVKKLQCHCCFYTWKWKFQIIIHMNALWFGTPPISTQIAKSK